jgi:hypothetical protein
MQDVAQTIRLLLRTQLLRGLLTPAGYVEAAERLLVALARAARAVLGSFEEVQSRRRIHSC